MMLYQVYEDNMAKVHTEVIIVKMSKLVKDNDNQSVIASDEIKNSLEAIVQELVGENIIVEIEEGT
jgi:hypothetical protein